MAAICLAEALALLPRKKILRAMEKGILVRRTKVDGREAVGLWFTKSTVEKFARRGRVKTIEEDIKWVAAWRKQGWTYKEIAARLKVSQGRAQQFGWRAKRRGLL